MCSTSEFCIQCCARRWDRLSLLVGYSHIQESGGKGTISKQSFARNRALPLRLWVNCSCVVEYTSRLGCGVGVFDVPPQVSEEQSHGLLVGFGELQDQLLQGLHLGLKLLGLRLERKVNISVTTKLCN